MIDADLIVRVGLVLAFIATLCSIGTYVYVAIHERKK
jgi:hypothetical protein